MRARGYFNGGVLLLRTGRPQYLDLLREAARDAQRPKARWYAEQGLLNERFPNYTRLLASFNLQGLALGFHRGVDQRTGHFVHEKIAKLPKRVLQRLGVSDL